MELENLISVTQNGNTLTVLCVNTEELGVLTKDELEEYIQENLNISLDIVEEQFREFQNKGRIDIILEEKKEVTAYIQASEKKEILEEPTIKEKNSSSNTIKSNTISTFSVFEDGNGMDAGDLLMKSLAKGYFVWKAIIRRNKSAYKVTMHIDENRLMMDLESIGIFEINLLETIAKSVAPKSTGMDGRIVNNYAISKDGNDYYLTINCIFDDGDGDVTGKYLLRHIDDIRKEVTRF